jgi:predicted S18 family serine protease
MTRLLVLLTFVSLTLGALTLAAARPASADPPATATCPDGYVLVSAIFSPKQDRNGDGFVCQKDAKTSPGGPDDTANPKIVDDIVL